MLDLFEKVLFPVAREMNLEDLTNIATFAEEEWYPSKIAFGKHKGRDFREAKTDSDLQSYLQWLADSDNHRSSALGQWYLDNLNAAPPPSPVFDFESPDAGRDENDNGSTAGVILWSDPELGRLKPLIETARARLAEVETEYGVLKSKIDRTRSIIFKSLRPLYESIDTLRLKIQYRRTFLGTLLREGEEETESFEEQFSQ